MKFKNASSFAAMMNFGSLSHVGNSPMFIPCLSLNNESVVMKESGGALVANARRFPGHGYCVRNLKKERLLVTCTYPNNDKRRFYVSFIPSTPYINGVTIGIEHKEKK